ncbi:lipid A deacylase LpxR family protein [Prolixibacteraceae bacterium Z1-6]|uniref:Lipid A deacylase LpxR family protein n=1 Tax=Draconibacterium aestuarii TaxID=2998507 RepID=A0A9X3F2T0_9BACT|nr:lipid A deacylase LpxR family protein [Prolixibacteraceae bacterium Z1-6]
MRFFFLIIASLLFAQLVSAQKLNQLKHEDHKEFFFHWDNDVFLFTDFYYTQGVQLFYVNPALRKNPANHFLPRLKNADNYFGIGLIQEIYTPKDITDSLMNLVDRPYAGTLFFRSFVTSVNPGKRLKLTSQLDLGFLGPLSGASHAQEIIHDWLGSKPPMGWDFQVENRPYINYNLIIEKEFIQVPQLFSLLGNSQLRAGNIHNDLLVGTNFRFGRLNNYFKGLHLANKKYRENKDFEFYVCGGLNYREVLYDATLMGGIIPPKEDNQFKFNQIEHHILEYDIGVTITYKMLSLKGKVIWKTPEFENGESHGWGRISFYIRL